jgi:hypothetical protein
MQQSVRQLPNTYAAAGSWRDGCVPQVRLIADEPSQGLGVVALCC